MTGGDTFRIEFSVSIEIPSGNPRGGGGGGKEAEQFAGADSVNLISSPMATAAPLPSPRLPDLH